jgi:hypothetical protein
MEVTGYLFLASLVGFALYSYFRRLPIVTGAVGNVTVTTTPVKAATDLAVLSARAKHGRVVGPRQAVLEVTDDPAQVGFFRARAALTQSLQPGGGTANPAGRTRSLLAAIPPVSKGKPLPAPGGGWVIYPGGAPPLGFQPKGTLLFSLSDFNTLQVTVSIGKEREAAKLKVGQSARVWCLQVSKDPLPGRVVKLAPGGVFLPEGKVVAVEASLEVLPPKARDRARRDFFSGKMAKDWKPLARITVGEQRLLHLIRRKR